jgi:oxygen-independent coproporphyrinogen-3 oxidase
MADAGYTHYEISNFARAGYESKHNCSYWDYTPYIGLGAGAYSFDGTARHNNIAHTIRYCATIESGSVFCEEEALSDTERYNEFVFTALRTKKGLDLHDLAKCFGQEKKEYAGKVAEKYIVSGWLKNEAGTLRLTEQGIYVSDTVMSDFMIVD